MELTQSKTVKTVAVLLLLAAISQPIYTALYLGAPEIDRQLIWGLEGLIFVVLAAFAGSALVMAKRYKLGFSSIAFSLVLSAKRPQPILNSLVSPIPSSLFRSLATMMRRFCSASPQSCSVWRR